MIDRSKEIFQICINHPLIPFIQLPPDLAKGILRGSSFPVSEAGIIKYWIEDRDQSIEQRLLTYTIVDRGNAKLARLSRLTRLWDPMFTNRLGLVNVALQLLVKPIEMWS